MRTDTRRTISLFTGAGGLDLGCEAAGFATVAAVEWNHCARETLLLNREQFLPALTVDAMLSDITKLSPGDLLAAAGAAPGEIALVHGGPPCTPFSKSGYWLESKRAGADPNASLVDEFVRHVNGVLPRAFIMENVYGLAYRNQNRSVFKRFLDAVRSAGYVCQYRVLLAADYGVPQIRQRLFCVGVHRDVLRIAGDPDAWSFQWPEQTHAGPHETRKGWNDALPLHVSSGEALAGLPDAPEPEEAVTGTFAEELRGVPPGENYLWWTEKRGHPSPRFTWRSRYWNFLLKLHPERPSPTIQGQPGPWVGPFHWDNRRLRAAELKRLMTFPDDFRVIGTRREQQLQLGNAVPPMLARVVALAVHNALDEIEGRVDLPLAQTA
ncbi:MAG: (cytosine-5)-methyltransferase 1 [Gaiellales bacterium]|jgi:DNA (cytosine-5)-methyltransferase 1|nr:(cytosine-5)-methyltransferase 1 [Gaiellales bacterium]